MRCFNPSRNPQFDDDAKASKNIREANEFYRLLIALRIRSSVFLADKEPKWTIKCARCNVGDMRPQAYRHRPLLMMKNSPNTTFSGYKTVPRRRRRKDRDHERQISLAALLSGSRWLGASCLCAFLVDAEYSSETIPRKPQKVDSTNHTFLTQEAITVCHNRRIAVVYAVCNGSLGPSPTDERTGGIERVFVPNSRLALSFSHVLFSIREPREHAKLRESDHSSSCHYAAPDAVRVETKQRRRHRCDCACVFFSGANQI